MPGTTEMQYLVLSYNGNPYLLARVRWPDVAQATSAGRPEWQDDLGLFDLPYDPASEVVTLAEAVEIARRWGAPDPAVAPEGPAPRTLIRRMPANWSDVTPAERQAWLLDWSPVQRAQDEERIVVGPRRRHLPRVFRRMDWSSRHAEDHRTADVDEASLIDLRADPDAHDPEIDLTEDASAEESAATSDHALVESSAAAEAPGEPEQSGDRGSIEIR